MDRIETSGEHTRLCEHSPQLPQGFTPVGNLTFWPGQLLGMLSLIFTYGSGTPGVSAYFTTKLGKAGLYVLCWPVFYPASLTACLNTCRRNSGGDV